MMNRRRHTMRIFGVIMIIIALLLPMTPAAGYEVTDLPERRKTRQLTDTTLITENGIDDGNTKKEESVAPASEPKPEPESPLPIVYEDKNPTNEDPADESDTATEAPLPVQYEDEATIETSGTEDSTPLAENEVQQSYLLNINYFYLDANTVELNGQVAAEPYYGSYLPGESYTVASPNIPGYEFSVETVAGTMGESDMVVDVWYSPSYTNVYAVEHLFEKLDGSGYAPLPAYPRQQLGGTTGALTNAVSHNVSGFVAGDVGQAAIASDGSTVVQVFYLRTGHFVYFNSNGGSYIDPIELKYEAEAAIPDAPLRSGFDFAGWYLDAALTSPYTADTIQMGIEDINLYAQWQAETVPFKVVFWLENPNDNNYSYWNTQTGSGVSGSMTDEFEDSYTPPPYTYYQKHEVENRKIEGDGSTVINIRYQRKLFHISFYRGGPLNVWDPNAWQGTIEKDPFYTITGKVGQFIGDQWQNAPNGFFDFRWISESEKHNPWANWISGLVSMGTVDRAYVGVPNSGPHQYYIRHMFEALDQDNGDYDKIFEDIKYVEDPFYLQQFAFGDASVTIRSNTNANIAGFKPASNYEQFSATADDPYVHNGYYFFNRNITTVSFDTLGGSGAPDSIVERYETDIKSQIPQDPTKDGFRFDGWYTNASTEGYRYDIDKAPASNLLLFAKWVPLQYMVAFDLNSGDEDGVERQQIIDRGKMASEPEAPRREGYAFKGWYENAGAVGSRFVFDKPIFEDLTLYAGWSGVQLADYTVSYTKEDTHEEYFPQKNMFDLVGTTVTETAYYSAGAQKYAPDHASKSLALSPAAGDNQMEFMYRPFITLAYRVEYRYADSHELLPESEMGATNPKLVTDTELSRVVETYRPVRGFTPDLYQKSLILTHETTAAEIQNNVLTFYYTPTSGIQYRVEHYLENPNREPGYPVYSDLPVETETLTGSAGQVVVAHSKLFAAYTYNEDVSSPTNSGMLVQNHNLVLRLYYDITRHVVSFNAQGGSAVSPITGVHHGSVLGGLRPADPIRAGYDFVGWNTMPREGREWNFNSDPVLSDITLYAEWQKQGSGTGGTRPTPVVPPGDSDTGKQKALGDCCCCCLQRHAVFFDTQGGNVITTIAKVYHADPINLHRPTDPTREGYNFLYWSVVPQGSDAWDFETNPVLDDMALYAVWREQNIGDTADLPTPYIAVTVPAEDVPDYGCCCGQTFTVVFDSQGGSKVDAIVDVRRGSILAGQRPADPAREGNHFVSWNTEAQNGSVWNFETDPICRDTTLYAVWREEGAPDIPQATPAPNATDAALKDSHTTRYWACCCCCNQKHVVTFDAQDDDVNTLAVEVYHASLLQDQRPATPQKEGYTFVGWYTAPLDGRAWDFDTDRVCKDITLYAIWQNQSDPAPILGGETPLPTNISENGVSSAAEQTDDSLQQAYQASVTLSKQTKINLRKKPRQNSAYTGSADKDSIVTVLSETGDWALVLTQNGAEGYMRIAYLTRQ